MKSNRALLWLGAVSSLLYIAMMMLIPLLRSDYSIAAHTVSELSAIGAPTRPLWVALAIVYTVLYAACGLGVWRIAGANRRLRVAGGLMIAHGIFGVFWPPMHMRGAPFTLTDAMHIVFAMVTLALMALTMGFAAAGLGKRFRLYTLVTLTVFVVFGVLTGLDSPAIAKNLPTPWIGAWERINIGAFMLWVIVLTGAVLRRRRS